MRERGEIAAKIKQIRGIERDLKRIQKREIPVPHGFDMMYRMTDYWLAVNHPKWKSRFGYPNGEKIAQKDL